MRILPTVARVPWRWLFCIVAVCQLVAAASAAATTPVSPIYLDATEAYEGLQVEPATITYTGDGTGFLGGENPRDRSSRIQWTDWTAKRADGTGFNQLNDCDPFCARGHFHHFRIRIEMWRPARIAGTLVFSRMTIFYLGAHPKGELSHYTFTDTYRAGGGFGWGPPDAEGYCTNTHGLKPAPSCRNIHSLPRLRGARADTHASAAHFATARRPKMLYPTNNYASRNGGVLWHQWIKPRHWSDGDDVVVLSARWTQWNARRAVARVSFDIAGQRGTGTVTLGSPGYCPAAHAFGYLTETDRGGPWGRGAQTNLSEECDSGGKTSASAASGSGSLKLFPFGLGPVHFGMDSATAERALSRPISVDDGINGCSTWTLPGAGAGGELIAMQGHLGFVLLSERGTETTRGISVGDRLDRLRRRYGGELHGGRTASLGYAEKRLFVTEHAAGTAYDLEFDIVHERVAFIDAASRHVIETFGECA